MNELNQGIRCTADIPNMTQEPSVAELMVMLNNEARELSLYCEGFRLRIAGETLRTEEKKPAPNINCLADELQNVVNILRDVLRDCAITSEKLG